MSRQHATPILIAADHASSVPLKALDKQHGFDEAAIQQFVQLHPSCLPIAEIDPLFCGPVPICTELKTLAGPIDNFMVTPTGLPVLVECKLWRNPEARREVVGQILDYAKALSLSSSSDLQREVSRRLNREGNAILDLVREAGHGVDEIDFNDALTLNLRRGRFLLLIVGDGIREGVEAIADYLQAHTGLHFTLGLVELPIYAMPDGGHLIAPRVISRTSLITRTVIAIPDGYSISEDQADEIETDDNEAAAFAAERVAFWGEFLSKLRLDDPEQSIPKAPKMGYMAFAMPAPNGSCWLTVYRDLRGGEVGVSLSSTRSSPGEGAMLAIVRDWSVVRDELGGTATLRERKGRPFINDHFIAGKFDNQAARERAFEWLRPRVNDFVNVMRPRVRAAIADLKDDI